MRMGRNNTPNKVGDKMTTKRKKTLRQNKTQADELLALAAAHAATEDDEDDDDFLAIAAGISMFLDD